MTFTTDWRPGPLARPNWEHWNRRPEATLEEAAALACGFNPKEIELLGAAHLRPPAVSELYELAVSHARTGRLPLLRLVPRPCVDLAAFAGWVRSLGRPLPDEFRPLGQGLSAGDDPPSGATQPPTRTPSPPGDGGVTVHLPHTTTQLEALFRVMREQWGNYKERGAPKSSTVALEIDKALGYKSAPDGKPSRNGDTLAGIIRPDEVKEADDPNLRRRRGK